MLRSWHETQEFQFLQFWLFLMCAYNVPDVYTYLIVLIARKYGPRRFQRRVARNYTTKARFYDSILNTKHVLEIQELLKVPEPRTSKITTINNQKVFDCFNKSCHRKIILAGSSV